MSATIIHGTTLVTNAIIERKGAKTALIDHAGLPRCPGNRPRESLRHLRHFPRKCPEPLVPRALRREVAERLDETGRILVRPESHGSARRRAEICCATGVEALAIALLHSFRNPEHERSRPRGRGIRVSVSDAVAVVRCDAGDPRVRAHLAPPWPMSTSSPIARATCTNWSTSCSRLGFRGDAVHHAVQRWASPPARPPATYPIRLMESGPAAGALAAAFTAQLEGYDRRHLLRYGRHHREDLRHRSGATDGDHGVRGGRALPLQERAAACR